MHLIYRSLYIVVDICTRGCNHIEAQDPSPTLGSCRLMGSRQGGSLGPKVHLARGHRDDSCHRPSFPCPTLLFQRERGLRLSSTKAMMALRLWTTLAVRAGPGAGDALMPCSPRPSAHTTVASCWSPKCLDAGQGGRQGRPMPMPPASTATLPSRRSF